MSMEADEYCRVYTNETYRARVQHMCCACGATIRPGDYYARVFLVDPDGDSETYRRCGRCEAIHAHLVEMCRRHGHAEWPDERLNCGHTYRERWDTEPPPEIAELAFVDSAASGQLLVGRHRHKKLEAP
jgi:hypothetical protein